jgi:Tol biopolymer transport system component
VAVLTVVAVTTLRPSSSAPAGPPATIPPGTWMTVNLDTGAMTALQASTGTKADEFVVSPTGTQIAYRSNQQIHLANIDGTNDRIITPGPATDALGLQWSPDGSKLVYQRLPSGSQFLGNLYVYDVLTGTTRRITNFQARQAGWYFTFPSFSSDGSDVLYQLPRGSANHTVWDLWSVPVAGGTPTMVQANAAWGAYGSGGWLAYLSPVSPRTFTGNALMIQRPGDASATVLVRGKGMHWLRFSPDGTRIAYAKGNTVYVVDVPGGTATRIASGSSPSWVDDRTLVIGPNG